MRLQTKLLALTTPFILIPILVLGTYIYLNFHKTVIENTIRKAEADIEQIHSKLTKRLYESKVNARNLANYDSIQKLLASQNEFSTNKIIKPQVFNLFEKNQTDYPYVEKIELVLNDGKMIISSSKNNSIQDNTKTNWFGAMSSKPELAQFIGLIEADNGASTLALLAQRINLTEPDSSAMTIGYLIFYIHLDMVAHEESKKVSINTSLILLLDKQRNIISSSHSNLIPWRISPKEMSSMLDASSQMKMTGININKEKFMAIAKQTEVDLSIAILVPENEITLITKNMANNITFAITVSFIIMIAFIFIGFRQIVVTPLMQIKKAAHAFGSGDLKKPLILKERFDEIGFLANSLEKMRRNLGQSQTQTQQLVNQDALTGLPNRRSVMERLDMEIEHCQRHEERQFALMFIDLDNFKSINDSMGHKAGDRLVIKVGQRLIETVRAYDSVSINIDNDTLESTENNNFVARLGGDEFLMILNDIDETADVARIAERIYGLFKEPLYIDEIQLHVGMSIGIVLYPGNGETPEQLIKNADIAMYSAKSAGKNQYRYYDDSMDTSARKCLEIESELRKALSENSLELYFQPQFNLSTREITGCEALIRWFHKERGWVSPAEFIPIAESCGLIHELGNWVLATACQQLRQWVDKGINIPCVSINLSSHQVASNGLAERINDLIKTLQLEPSMLEFELTETAIFNNREIVMRNLESIRKTGARIALDDFGTGYSSLAWVQYCTVDVIKIDRTFVTDLPKQPKHKAIVASVVELCRQLKLAIVAEGIESLEEAEILNDLGCDFAQGYYYSRPLAVKDFEEFIKAYDHKLPFVENG